MTTGTAAVEARAEPGTRRQFVDHYCPSCGMFLMATDAPPGKRVRVRCESKRCKGKVREVVVEERRAA